LGQRLNSFVTQEYWGQEGGSKCKEGYKADGGDQTL